MTVWHLDPEAIRRYSQGAALPDLAASAEAHLMKCAACRGVISSHVDARRVETIWHEVVDRVDVPRRTWPERMLARLGVGEATARLVAATPTLRGPWLLAVAGVLVLAAWAAQVDERLLGMFLVVAPLGPLAGVAVAFAGGLDPRAATPMTTRAPQETTHRRWLPPESIGVRRLIVLTRVISGPQSPSGMRPCSTKTGPRRASDPRPPAERSSFEDTP
jgi:hypothetical protein